MGHRRQWREYRTAAGARPVRAALDELTDLELADVIAAMKEVQQIGLTAARHLRGDLYEVRAETATRSFRVLFAAEGRFSQVFLALVAFTKTTQKTPPRLILLAEHRLAEWRARGRG